MENHLSKWTKLEEMESNRCTEIELLAPYINQFTMKGDRDIGEKTLVNDTAHRILSHIVWYRIINDMTLYG